MKVLLIGNGPSALENDMGDRIDSNEFDAVFRLNRGHKQDDGSLNKGFEKQTGTRCDYWIASDLRTQLAIERRNDYQGVFVVTPKFKWNPQYVKHVSEKYPKVQFIPPAYENDINSIIDFSPKWPSTGVVAIHFAVNHFEEVYIYGFDTYDIKYDNQHYFENKPNKYKDISHKDHDPSKEKQYIKYMLNNNKIKTII